MSLDPQILASEPGASAFVTANAGSGKTRTLVDRVARLLLGGAKPETILCVTYTKAAAAEMQRRLFETLGGWAVMADAPLSAELARIGEHTPDLARARRLFALALETPGGLKIQTIHAFCEKLLHRFPLEAGVSPNFEVLEDQAARAVSAKARRTIALAAEADPLAPLGRAYTRFAVALDFRSFEEMFAAFEAKRPALAAYFGSFPDTEAMQADVWRACGFDEPALSAELEAEAMAFADWPALKAAGQALLATGAKTDADLGGEILAVVRAQAAGVAGFDDLWGAFCTKEGKAKARLGTKGVDAGALAVLAAEQQRLGDACERIRSARVAEDSLAVLSLAAAYVSLYDAAKQAQGGLDFADLIGRTRELITWRAEAAWVLYKLDGGVDHVLVDEAQDTSPEQWDIVRALTAEFFSGAGARRRDRTVFAVGDEKQSIYSFQGADPKRFADERLANADLVRSGGGRFETPELIRSFRSTPEVLTFVDTVFRPADALKALRPDRSEDPIRHQAVRPEGHGAVEVWPLEVGDVTPDDDPWAPVDQDPPESAPKKLARRIARQIKAMVARGEAVFAKNPNGPDEAARPMGYGDVLILVRRRNALFHEIIRALKREDVPVGGADRMTLSDHIVFQDMVGLGRFCLFPQDDLTLAALLRSPFCDVDEDSLFALAYGRTGTLWTRLLERAEERPEWRSARDFLRAARAEARSRPPFDAYARLLGRTDPAGRSMRARILARLGREAEQALDAFLAEALKSERRGVRDLESFVADMASTAVEVKREQEDGKGEVRVMTVHGAKGLEAPVVILPDTTTKASAQGGPLLETEAGGFLWCARKGDDCSSAAAARQRRSDAGDAESLRLLYVALTRARDRLIVCGVEPGKPGMKAGSWWDWVQRALDDPGIAPLVRELPTQDGEPALRFGPDPVTAPAAPAIRTETSAAPTWLMAKAPPEPPALAYASPSQMAEAQKGPSPSPLASSDGLGRFRRGDLIHRLLQLLPDLPPGERRAAAASLLAREHGLTPDQRAEMAAAALGVLEDPQFAAVFGPGSRAEAAVAGTAPDLPEGLAVSGRLDRLVIEPRRVLVADFKTNRPSPDRIEDADKAYVTQMAVYAAVLRAAFPGRRVEAALVWTDGPKLMPVPENLMAEALKALPPSR
jgi:ATP-dependent helicase/nuclease subunit A